MTFTFKISRRLARIRAPLLLLMASALIAACGADLSTDPTSTPGVGGPPGIGPVATVIVTPGNSAIGLTDFQQLAATLQDASGNGLSGRAIAWTSDAPLVASVSPSGQVTGLLEGTATITASSEGQSGSATVSVSVVPPPVGGSWPHEPSSYPLLTDNPFNLLTALGWGMAWNDFGYSSIVSDATAPESPSSVLEMRYPAGFAGSVGPGNAWYPLPNLRRMFAGFWWKASNPWQGHASNVNKILFAFPASGGDVYMAMYGPPGGPYELRVLPQFPGLPSEWLVPNVSNVPVTVGGWHRIEWQLEYNTTTGPANGIVKWWMDGTLIGNYGDVEFPSGGLTEFKINPTWGGVGDVKTENDYFRYDQIHLSGS